MTKTDINAIWAEKTFSFLDGIIGMKTHSCLVHDALQRTKCVRMHEINANLK